jgi:hypothetical protein
LSALGHVVEVRKGDALLVDRVEPVSVGTHFREFEHPNETQELAVSLKVLGPGRAQTRVGGVIRYSRAASALGGEFNADKDLAVFNELVARLEGALGIQDLQALIEDAYANPSIELPLQQAELPEHVEALAALYRACAGIPEAFATFGYQMGRAEAHARVLPLAISAKDRVEHGAEESRKVRSDKAKKWQAHADKVATALGAPSPDLNGLALARAVRAHWLEGFSEAPKLSVSDRHLAEYLLKRFRHSA